LKAKIIAAVYIDIRYGVNGDFAAISRNLAVRILSRREFQNGAHLYAGTLYGLSPIASPAALFKYRRPIHALYQAGQTTWPGFGVVSAGLSGVMAVEALIHDEVR
jgi:phytoene desaturase